MKQKIERLLKYYYEKLEKVNKPPVDYIEGIRISAKIDLLETLYLYSLEELR